MTEIARRSAVNDDYCTQALQTALELSMLNIGGGSSSSGSSRHAVNVSNVPEVPESKSQNVTECVAVPSSEHVAEIVGRQGCKIKALRAKTNTYIKTPVRGEEPVFSISGRPEHVSSARREILELVEHLSELRASRKGTEDKVATIHVRVPYHVVGLVVGPKGATVKRIQQVTQTYIVTPSRDKEPYFEVKGAPANVERAKKEIERYIALRTKIDSFDANEDPGNLDIKASGLQSTVEGNLSSHFHKTLRHDPQSADLLSSPVFHDVQSHSLGSNALDSFSMSQSSSKLSTVFQFPNTIPSTSNSNGSILARDTLMDGLGGSGFFETQKFHGKPPYKSQTVFSGMRFTPPSSSYQPMTSPQLTSENSFNQGFLKNVAQPISPTGSFDSSCSDGITSVSPSISPHPCLFTQSTAAANPVSCYLCNADEDMAALIPCRHSNFCWFCARYIACAQGSCPLCHTQVTNVLHL